MTARSPSVVYTIIADRFEQVLHKWIEFQHADSTYRSDLVDEAQLRVQCRDFLSLLRWTMEAGEDFDLDAPKWDDVRHFLAELSRARAQQGFSPPETAMFVFSLKYPLLAELHQALGGDLNAFMSESWALTKTIHKLGLYTTEVHLKTREETIRRQQQELLELSNPVVQLWEGVLALPLIGTLDSARSQVVMEGLLERIIETGSPVAIIDITGVPTVDTLVAQYLLKTVAAARLMGADCIISGIRPQIAQAMVHLGVQLEVTTRATLADAFQVALKRLGVSIERPRVRI